MVDVFPVIAPPVATVFLWGVFLRRTSSRVALAILVGRSLVGLVIFTLTRMEWIRVNSLFMAFVLFVVESAVIVLLPWVWPHRHTPKGPQLVWTNPRAVLQPEGTRSTKIDYRWGALALLSTMVELCWWFNSPEPCHPFWGQIRIHKQPAAGLFVFPDLEESGLVLYF
jgi:SSS family solute:Na+ symporter